MPIATQGKTISSSAQVAAGTIINSDLANDTLENDKISPTAAIAMSKLNLAITNAEVDASAAIEDGKLDAISEAGKVDGAALTGLANIPAGAGEIPTANLPAKGTFERLGESVLGSAAATISLTSLSARKHLIIEFHGVGRTVDNNLDLTFNNDTGTNYCKRTKLNDDAEALTTSDANITFPSLGTGEEIYFRLYVTNRGADEKLVIGHVTMFITGGSGTAPQRREYAAKWVNTSDQITRVDIGQSSGNMNAGTRLTVYGSED